MTYGLLLWKLPHVQESYVHPELANFVQPERTHRFAQFYRALKARVFSTR